MESYNDLLIKLSKKIPQEERKRVLLQPMCEIGGDFMGFLEPYWCLSKLIPKDWTIFDFGCCYNAQCYFFDNHKAYHAIEPIDPHGQCTELFHTENTIIHRCTTGEFLKNVFPTLNVDINKCFAIVNNVPNWYKEDSMKLVHEVFRNCYTFYIA